MEDAMHVLAITALLVVFILLKNRYVPSISFDAFINDKPNKQELYPCRRNTSVTRNDAVLLASAALAIVPSVISYTIDESQFDAGRASGALEAVLLFSILKVDRDSRGGWRSALHGIGACLVYGALRSSGEAGSATNAVSAAVAGAGAAMICLSFWHSASTAKREADRGNATVAASILAVKTIGGESDSDGDAVTQTAAWGTDEQHLVTVSIVDVVAMAAPAACIAIVYSIQVKDAVSKDSVSIIVWLPMLLVSLFYVLRQARYIARHGSGSSKARPVFYGLALSSMIFITIAVAAAIAIAIPVEVIRTYDSLLITLIVVLILTIAISFHVKPYTIMPHLLQTCSTRFRIEGGKRYEINMFSFSNTQNFATRALVGYTSPETDRSV